jgi:hypothetical protein
MAHVALRRRRVAACAMLLLVGGCVNQEDVGPWGLREARVLVHGGSNISATNPASGEFQIVVPLGVDRRSLVISAGDNVTIGSGAKILLDSLRPNPLIATAGTMVVRSKAQVGSIHGAGDLTVIDDQALAQGYLKTCGTLRMRNAYVSAGVLEHASCGIEEYRWNVPWPARNNGSRMSQAGDGALLELPPGPYDHLHVEQNSIMRLRTGTYYTNALTVDPEGLLEIDNTAGPVQIWIRDSLVLRHWMLDYSVQPSILFGYAGKSPPVIDTHLRGTFVAPVTTITLPATKESHSGAFFAQSVVLADGASVEYRPVTRSPWTVSSAEICEQCSTLARQSVQQCCRDFDRKVATAMNTAALCPVSCESTTEASDLCTVQCKAQLTMHIDDARSWLNGCIHAVSIGYGRCQLEEGYRPDTCTKLGYPGYEPIDCEG